MKALIDADMVLYASAFAAEKTKYFLHHDGLEAEFENKREANKFIKDSGIDRYELIPIKTVQPLENAKHLAKGMMENILDKTAADDYVAYLSGDGNFRYDIHPLYKYGRPPKPFHYTGVRNYLIDVWRAVVVDGQEADDQLGIDQCFSDVETIICTRDKDLDMIPGWHYNWHTDEKYFVSEEDGLRFFYEQLITGDRTDNIPGLYKVTGQKAKQSFKDSLKGMNEREMWEYVLSLYGEELEDDLISIGRLLWIRRKENEMWLPPS